MEKAKYKMVAFGSGKKTKNKKKVNAATAAALDLEERMGISFNSQFNYESGVSFDSIFSYGSQDSPCQESKIPEKFKYKQSIIRRDDEWASGGISPPKDTISVAIRNCLILISAFVLLLMFPILGWVYVKRIKPNERLVVYRLGHRQRIKGPGLTTTLPWIDKEYKVNLEETSITVASLSGASKDGGLAELEQVHLIYQVEDPVRVVTEVRDLNKSLRHLLSTSILSEMRRFNVSDLSCALTQISSAILYTMNDMCTKWGVRLVRANIGSAKITCDAPSPTSFLSKIDFSAVGRQLSMFAPLLQSSSTGNVSSNDTGSPSPSTSAINSFFEKLEEMKQLALQHQKELGQVKDPLPTGEPMNTINMSPDNTSECSVWFDQIEKYLVVINDLLNAYPNGEQMKTDLGQVLYQFRVNNSLSGEQNQHMFCYIDARRGQAGIGEVQLGAGDVHISICLADLLEIIQGKCSTIGKVLSGKIQIRGDLSTASKLQVLRRYFNDLMTNHVAVDPPASQFISNISV